MDKIASQLVGPHSKPEFKHHDKHEAAHEKPAHPKHAEAAPGKAHLASANVEVDASE